MFIFFRLYYGEVDPHTGMLYFVMGFIQLLLGKSEEALGALNKASAVIRIIYGDTCFLLRQLLKLLLIAIQARYSS